MKPLGTPPKLTMDGLLEKPQDEQPLGERSTTRLHRTMSDIYQDEFISPLVATSALPQQAQQDAAPENLVSSKKNSVFADLFQVAQDGHLAKQSASPVRDLAEKQSPFARTLPVFISMSQLLEQMRAEELVRVLAEHQPRASDFASPRTISPRAVALGYNEAGDLDSGVRQQTLQHRDV